MNAEELQALATKDGIFNYELFRQLQQEDEVAAKNKDALNELLEISKNHHDIIKALKEPQKVLIALKEILLDAGAQEINTSSYEENQFVNYETVHDAQKIVKGKVWDFVKDFARIKRKGGLIFLGNTGTGKTHLFVAMLKALILQGYYDVRYVNAERIVIDHKKCFERKDLTEEQVRDRYITPHLLVIDEFGFNSLRGSQEERRIFFNLIHARHLAKKPTCLGSNLTEEQIEGFLGEAFWSRLCDDSEILKFTWEDKRRLRA